MNGIRATFRLVGALGIAAGVTLAFTGTPEGIGLTIAGAALLLIGLTLRDR